jgi:hypothetical protein
VKKNKLLSKQSLGSFFKWVWVILIFLQVSFASAQQKDWDSLAQKFIHYQRNGLQEKIFAHLDRSLYVAGETMWFKLYYIDGYLHRPLDVSKVAYVEILDGDNNAVIQTKVSLNEGAGNGQVLLPISINSGNYLVRVYTSWMKNFSPEYYFQQQITILNTVRRTEPVSKINSGAYDIQFFPEGGHLVDGIKSTVAFRIVDQLGIGKDVSGDIINKQGDTIASFRPLKFGIGKFSFLPSSSEQYKVVLTGIQVNASISFPIVQPSGYVIRVIDTLTNQLKVSILYKGMASSSHEVYLLVHTRQMVKIALAKSLSNGAATLVLDKNKLGEGISHITVFNEDQQPVCERLIFKHPVEKLSVKVKSDQEKYSARKKIKLSMQVTSNFFQLGKFSMTVFKDDSLSQVALPDIQGYELLTSDLKGKIESPLFYFSSDPLAIEATNNLMLTHGWSRFKWEDILTNTSPPILFNPEYRGPIVTGNIIDVNTGAPASGILTYLSTPSKNIRLYGSRSDSKGNLYFEIRDLYEKKKLIVQPNLSKDSTFKIDINSPYSETFSSYSLSPINIKPAWRDQVLARNISMQTVNTYFGKSSTYKYFSIDSGAFYGIPDEKYLLDEYTRFSVMEEVMREYVHGVWVRKKDGKFIFKVPDEPNNGLFQNESMVLLDGVPIFDVDKIIAYSPLKVQQLDVLTRKYFLGPFTFEGLVSYSTYRGDLDGFELDPKATVVDYQGLQFQKEFFSPRYQLSSEVESRLADRRNLLFWAPNITLLGNETQSVEFYSSDEPGVYKVIIQGIDANGIPGSATTTFEVTAPKNN